MIPKKCFNRREFLGSAATTLAVSIVPRHVLGGPGYVAPSDKIALAYIGCGTQGLREMMRVVANPEVQIVAVCDPEKDNTNYVDWSPNDIRDSVRELLENPTWGEGVKGIRAGREVGKEVVETYYAKKRSSEKYKGCSTYADFRELLEKEKDLDAVKIMTPDHLHATISIAAMKKGKHVVMHKPLANRVSEVRLVVETARKTGVATHLSAWGHSIDSVRDMIKDGAIGTLREVHNWTDRPFWPQFQSLPTDRPPVPASFDWNLWLGPELDRPYHPNYTHAVFRGWYDFGGGSIADMGNYSLWPIFMALDLPVPSSIEATPSSYVEIVDQISAVKMNDFSFPNACRVRFKFPAQGNRPPLSLYWYDGGMRPFTPEELEIDKKAMPATGTMFVGDKGTILDGRLIPEKRMSEYQGGKAISQQERRRGGPRDNDWIIAFKGGKPSPGNFLNAAACSETISLAGAVIRFSRRNFREGQTTPPLEWDAQDMKFTNLAEANQFLYREYRQGWKL
ncbi:MAG TPA: Gfo/Idh/MocA family oxidoreductase [Terriglobia bacterium]|nr:Gfo/Idh/MocA family oxidoreductase [Terriglobia bacterium]